MIKQEASQGGKTVGQGKTRSSGRSRGHRKNLSLPDRTTLSPLKEEPTTPKTFDFIKPQEKRKQEYSAQAPAFIPHVSKAVNIAFPQQPRPPIVEQIDALEANMRQIFSNLRTYDMIIENKVVDSQVGKKSQPCAPPMTHVAATPSIVAKSPAATLFEAQQVSQLLEAMAHGELTEVVDARRKNLIRTWIDMGVLEAKKMEEGGESPAKMGGG